MSKEISRRTFLKIIAATAAGLALPGCASAEMPDCRYIRRSDGEFQLSSSGPTRITLELKYQASQMGINPDLVIIPLYSENLVDVPTGLFSGLQKAFFPASRQSANQVTQPALIIKYKNDKELITWASIINNQIWKLNGAYHNRLTPKSLFGTNLSESDVRKLLAKSEAVYPEETIPVLFKLTDSDWTGSVSDGLVTFLDFVPGSPGDRSNPMRNFRWLSASLSQAQDACSAFPRNTYVLNDGQYWSSGLYFKPDNISPINDKSFYDYLESINIDDPTELGYPRPMLPFSPGA